VTTEYLTPDEVAKHLQVSRQVVYNWINDGRLRAVKAGRTLRIPQYALEAFLQPVNAGDISTGDIEPGPQFPRERFTAAAQAAIEAAHKEVIARQHLQAEVEHSLWGLLLPAGGVAQQALERMGIDPQVVIQQVDQALAKLPTDASLQPVRNMIGMAPTLMPIMQRMEELASEGMDLQIDASHIFIAIVEQPDGTSAQILRSAGVTPERLRNALLEVRAAQLATAPPSAPQPPAHRGAAWEQRIEQQLTRLETELAAIRALLTRPGDETK